jgi:hypothetical protein
VIRRYTCECRLSIDVSEEFDIIVYGSGRAEKKVVEDAKAEFWDTVEEEVWDSIECKCKNTG